tara:strand:+ start:499 stop:1449 length:951 start_codon:yes stop_codon:yes gene_type:complete
VHFDNIQIKIRERGFLDLMDLGLQVFRVHLPRFLLAFACGAVPLQILNHFWFRDLVVVDFREGLFTANETSRLIGFILCVGQMIFIESQLAGIIATKYLGLVLFQEEPRIRPVLREVGRAGWRLLWCQGLTRGVVVAVVLASWSRSSNWSFVWLGMLTCLVVLVRALRPFLNEIVLLENNPLLATKSHSLTIGRRSYRLHAPSSGMLLGRWFCSALIGIALSISVAGIFLFVSGVLFQQWFPGPFLIQIGVPLAMWIVAAYLTVVRFLNYLDLRIRDEGWEVELRMRSEAARLEQQMTPRLPIPAGSEVNELNRVS